MIDDLVQKLRNAATTADARTALPALAELDPAGALKWLGEHPDAPGTLGRGAFSRGVEAIAHAIEAGRFEPPAAAVISLLSAHHTALPDGLTDRLASGLAGASWSDLRDLVEHRPTPALLRLGARLAAEAGEPARAHLLLTDLGRADPALGTMQQIMRARKALAPMGGPPVRVALLSSFTADPLLPYVDLECRSLGLEPALYLAPFNSWAQEILNDGSGLSDFDPDVAFLSVAADDLIPELSQLPPADDLLARGRSAVEHLLAVAARFAERHRGVLVVHGLYSAHRDPLGAAGAQAGMSRSEVSAELNRVLAEGFKALTRTHFLDVADLALRRAHGRLDNPKMRHLAGMRLSEHLLGDVALAYAGYIAAVKGLTRKCVVLDLDNTLWGGVVGEDGPHGIKLGNTSPGSEYREFQQYLKTLTQRGILLAVNSKNNPDDALEVIRSHESMVLRESDFSAMQINWDPKAENMRRLAQELGLGLDSFVFLDDNPNERALMRQILPEILTPEMPRDPALYRETLERLPQLTTLVITKEDTTRAEQYRARKQREQLKVTTQNLDDYLGSLEIQMEIGRAHEATLPRVHQLFQRTNQFNLSGRRYELAALTGYASDPGWRVYTAKVADRFGDHGLVAAALVKVADPDWVVENFVMSCRVIGYGVETALLAHVAEEARTEGAGALVGEYIQTAKNAPAKDFYARHEFAAPDGAQANGVHRWSRPLAGGTLTPPKWISLKEAHAS